MPPVAERHVPAGHCCGAAKLPPTDSVDRLLLFQSSRLVYALAGVVAAAAPGPLETAFVTRPSGGAALDWRFGYRTLTDFPEDMPETGAEAVATAAALLRSLWDRLPVLRSAIAHVTAVTFLSVCNAVGDLRVWVFRRDGGGGAGGGGSGAGGAGGAGSESADGFAVNIPEELVQARMAGMLLARLDEDPRGLLEGGGGGGGVEVAEPGRRHPLLRSVEARLRATTIRRVDGIVLGTLDVEDFDETVC